jgi:hypothetical protein
MTDAIASENTLVLQSTMRRRPGKETRASVRPSCIAKTLALAHHLQRAINDGAIKDRASLARAFRLSRVRITQILGLLSLAPDIQEVLLASRATGDHEPFAERDLRAIYTNLSWEGQRLRFVHLRKRPL